MIKASETLMIMVGVDQPPGTYLDLYGVQIPWGMYPAVQRNTTMLKDASHKVPKPVVVTAKINGHST